MKAPLFFNRISLDRSRLDRKRRNRIASIEPLESRALLAGFTWNNTAGGDFNVAANWNENGTSPVVHAVPGPGDDAYVPQAPDTITVSGNITVNSFNDGGGDTLNVTSGTFSILNSVNTPSSTVSNLDVASGASFSIANQSATIGQSATIAGNLNVGAGATLYFAGNQTGSHLQTGATLTGAGAFTVQQNLFVDGTVTAPTNLILNSINSDGIDGSGTLNVPSGATLDWQSGSMQGSGITNIAIGATLLLDTFQPDNLQDRTLNIAGTAIASGTGNLGLVNSAVINNSGAFAFTNDASVTGTGIFNNSGTITKTSPSGTGVTFFATIFNNSGTVTAQTGTLDLASSGIDTGLFNDPSAAGSIDITGSNYSFNAGATFTGSGTIALNGTNNGSNGININTNVSIPNARIFSGYLDGAGNLTVTGTLTTNNAFINLSGSLNLPTGSTLIVTGAGNTTTFANLTVNDSGTTTLSGTDSINLSGTAVFNNSGTFTIANDSVSGGGLITLNGATFNNTSTGTLIKTSNSGPSGLSEITSGIFYNRGKISAVLGQLQLDVTLTNTGVFDAQTSGTVVFTQLVNLNAGTTFTGPGLFENGNGSTGVGSINVNASITDSRLKIIGQTVNVASGATFTVNLFNFVSGTISGQGVVSIPAGGVVAFNSSADKYFSSSQMTVYGTANWSSTGNIDLSNGALLYFEPGSTFNATNDQTINGAGTETVNLAGTFNKTSLTGVGTTIIDSPTNILPGGLINIASGNLTTSSLVNVGTISLGSQTVLTVNGTFTQPNAGTLNIAVGGTPASALFGQLNVSSTASLNGTLNVSRANGYIPIVGAVYPILTASNRSGNFTGFTSPNNGIAALFSSSPQTTGVNLVATTSLPTSPTALAIFAADDTGGVGVTAIHQPRLTGKAQPGLFVQFYNASQQLVASALVGANGTFVAPLTSALSPGTYTFQAVSIDTLGDYSASTSFTLTISAPPVAPTGLNLYPADDNQGAGKTSIRQPRLTGTATPGLFVQIFEQIGSNNVLIGSAVANPTTGVFIITPSSPFSVGVHILKAVAIDAGGNYGSSSTPFSLTIV